MFETYSLAVSALGAAGVWFLVQLTVVDVVSIRAKHPPGGPVEANHDNGLFRVTRTVANTNESVAIFILAILFCLASGASPEYTGYAAWSYVVSRVVYAFAYYFDIRTFRSIVFGVSLLSLTGLLVIGFMF